MKRCFQILSILMMVVFAAVIITAASGATQSAAKAKTMNSSGCNMKQMSGCNMKQMSGCMMSGMKPVSANSLSKNKSKVAHKKLISAVCPVMGTKIPDVSKAAGKSVYKGKTYYFCCPGCKPQFDKNPAKYIKK